MIDLAWAQIGPNWPRCSVPTLIAALVCPCDQFLRFLALKTNRIEGLLTSTSIDEQPGGMGAKEIWTVTDIKNTPGR